MKAWPFALAGGVVFGAGALVATEWGDPPFPHDEHATLFPACEGCHAGVHTGVDADLYPDRASCAECHDGERAGEVEWSPPGPRVGNLRFFHPDHPEVVSEAVKASSCSTCHLPEEPATRLSVQDARGEGCVECHAHAADEHLAEGVACSVCHVSLPEADRVPVERVAAFPWPASHDEPDFLSRHAPETALQGLSCSVCHARETCERCHVNADHLDEVTALVRDERVAFLEAEKDAEYPTPGTHEDRDWSWDHGATALGEPARCANCHTRPGCEECHLDGARTVESIRVLPLRDPEGPPGVELENPSDRVHPPDFADRHGGWDASGSLECAECHRNERYCADCHAGVDAGAPRVSRSGGGSDHRGSVGPIHSSSDYHPPNFLERHAFEAYAGDGSCQSCHSTEVFCRDCHEQSGLAPESGGSAAFHTGDPLWVLSHGDAARVALGSCAACHQQMDCLQCHSAAGGWGVDPHGPGFDADRMRAQNRATCRWCHLDEP